MTWHLLGSPKPDQYAMTCEHPISNSCVSQDLTTGQRGTAQADGPGSSEVCSTLRLSALLKGPGKIKHLMSCCKIRRSCCHYNLALHPFWQGLVPRSIARPGAKYQGYMTNHCLSNEATAPQILAEAGASLGGGLGVRPSSGAWMAMGF